jgi:hypothetical protein
MTTEILQSLGIAVAAVLGGFLGIWFARRRSVLWLAGFILPLILILMIGATRRWYPLGFVVPFSWLVAGRTEFAIVGPLAAMMMFTPIARMPRTRLRMMVSCFVPIFIVQSSILPFLMPGIQRRELAKLTTTITRDGVCRQSTDYTCGPAAAVTALRAVGISATEADIALLAHTSRSTGTEPDVLADVLQTHFADKGLTCIYRPFHNAAELPTDRPIIALIEK